MRLSINQDAVAGFLFVLFGAAALWIGREYPLGTAMRMGAGYFPYLLSWLLIAFGVAIGIKGVVKGGEGLGEWRLRPVLFVLLSFIVFAILVERIGLPVAAVASVLTGALGSTEFRWREQIVLSVALAIAFSALFIYGLGLPMRLWPS